MSDWVYLQASAGEQLMQLHYFSIVKQQAAGDVTFAITVKEFAVPPVGQRVRFYAEADKAVNQKTASFVPCGWGDSIFSALGDCVRLIRQFPYEAEGGGHDPGIPEATFGCWGDVARDYRKHSLRAGVFAAGAGSGCHDCRAGDACGL